MAFTMGDLGKGFGLGAVGMGTKYLYDKAKDSKMMKDIGYGLSELATGGAGAKRKAARDNARKQQQAMLEAGQISRASYDRNMQTLNSAYDKAEQQQTPYQQFGQRGMERLEGFVDELGQAQPGYQDEMGPRSAAFSPEKFQFQMTDEARQKIAESTNAVQSSAAAKGLLGSSGALKAIQQNAANIANQNVNDQFSQHMQQQNLGKDVSDTAQNLYTTDRDFSYGKYSDQLNQNVDALNRKYNALSGMTNVGQAAANNLTNLATGRGTSLANEGSNLAEIEANLKMGAANAQSARNNAIAQSSADAYASGRDTMLQLGSMAATAYGGGKK